MIELSKLGLIDIHYGIYGVQNKNFFSSVMCFAFFFFHFFKSFKNIYIYFLKYMKIKLNKIILKD